MNPIPIQKHNNEYITKFIKHESEITKRSLGIVSLRLDTI